MSFLCEVIDIIAITEYMWKRHTKSIIQFFFFIKNPLSDFPALNLPELQIT